MPLVREREVPLVGRGLDIESAAQYRVHQKVSSPLNPRIGKEVLTLLAHFSLITYGTPCITINKKMRRCATTQGNPETMRMGSVPSSKYSEEDVKRNYTSCALIGNGPGLFKQNKADIIDKHDAVFRFNSLHNIQYQGKKTTFRILNNKRVEGLTKKRVKIKLFTPGEAWIIWHYFSLKKYAELKKLNENSRIVAPDYLKFELRAYFGIRKDLKRFGNSMRCPMNLNSGMHGILMALKMCDEVNLFGFSYQKHTVNNSQRNTRSKNFQNTVVSPRLSKHHDWHTDALVVKVRMTYRYFRSKVRSKSPFSLFFGTNISSFSFPVPGHGRFVEHLLAREELGLGRESVMVFLPRPLTRQITELI